MGVHPLRKIYELMKKIYYILILTILLVSSCTKEGNVGDDRQHSGDEFYIELGTKGGVDLSGFSIQDESEMKIHSATVLFYENAFGREVLVYNVATKRGDPDANDFGRIEGTKIIFPRPPFLANGHYKVVVVVNEFSKPTVSQICSTGSFLSELENFTTSGIPDNNLSRLTMSGIGSYTPTEESNFVSVDLVRQHVKLIVNVKMDDSFIRNFPDAVFGNGETGVGVPEITVMNIPQLSYLSERKNPMVPQGSDFFSLKNREMVLVSEAEPSKWSFTTYVNENPVQGSTDKEKESSTHFILRLPYRLNDGQDVVTENYYMFHIKDPKDLINPHKTVRNTIYYLNVTVNGFGSEIPNEKGAYVNTMVMPWGEVENPAEVGGYLKFDEVMDHNYQTLPSGGNIFSDGETLSISCNTNIGGWYVILKDQNGQIIRKSAQTSVVKAPTMQSVDLVIDPLGLEAEKNYSIEICHPTYAPETKPLETLHYTQIEGFLSNHLLSANHWPTHKLPPRGLQLAKRGNQLPLVGVASEIDQLASSWGPYGFTGVSDQPGAGKENTAILKNLGSYPAANLCAAMGEGWYLPSMTEFLIIYNLSWNYSEDYIFKNDMYWSSSEVSETESRVLDFLTQSNFPNDKQSGHCFVRCVRNL